MESQIREDDQTTAGGSAERLRRKKMAVFPPNAVPLGAPFTVPTVLSGDISGGSGAPIPMSIPIPGVFVQAYMTGQAQPVPQPLIQPTQIMLPNPQPQQIITTPAEPFWNGKTIAFGIIALAILISALALLIYVVKTPVQTSQQSTTIRLPAAIDKNQPAVPTADPNIQRQLDELNKQNRELQDQLKNKTKPVEPPAAAPKSPDPSAENNFYQPPEEISPRMQAMLNTSKAFRDWAQKSKKQ